jgi:hypothetical protein
MDTTFSKSLIAPLMLILLGISNGAVSVTPLPLNDNPTFIQQYFTSNNPEWPSVFDAGFNSGNK